MMHKIIRFREKKCENINTILLPIAVISFFSWYIYPSSGRFFQTMYFRVDTLFSVFSNEFGQSSSTEGLKMIQDISITQIYFTHEITKYLNLITIFGIFIGLVYFTLYKRDKNSDVWAICSGFFLILVFTVILPRFSQALNFARFYQIGLLPLSFISIIGMSITFYYIYSIFKLPRKGTPFKILGCFFMIFFLFNTGFIYEVVKDNSNSIALNKDLNYPIWSESEIHGLSWSEDYITNNYSYIVEPRLNTFFLNSYSEKLRISSLTNIKISVSPFEKYFIGDKRDNEFFWQKSNMIYNSKAIRVLRL